MLKQKQGSSRGFAMKAVQEELEAKGGETLLIPGGSGSFGQMAVPIAKALGLRVIVTGNERAKESILAAGADQYLDYRKEHYWEILSGVDYVIDTLGAGEFQRELSVLKPGGRLLTCAPDQTSGSQQRIISVWPSAPCLPLQARNTTGRQKSRTRNTILSSCAPMARSFGKLPKSWSSITLFPESIPGSLPWRRRRTPLRW